MVEMFTGNSYQISKERYRIQKNYATQEDVVVLSGSNLNDKQPPDESVNGNKVKTRIAKGLVRYGDKTLRRESFGQVIDQKNRAKRSSWRQGLPPKSR